MLFRSLRNRCIHLFVPPNVCHILVLGSRDLLLSLFLDEIHSEHMAKQNVSWKPHAVRDEGTPWRNYHVGRRETNVRLVDDTTLLCTNKEALLALLKRVKEAIKFQNIVQKTRVTVVVGPTGGQRQRKERGLHSWCGDRLGGEGSWRRLEEQCSTSILLIYRRAVPRIRLHKSVFKIWRKSTRALPIQSTAITASIFLRLHLANPLLLDRSLFAFVLCFYDKKSSKNHKCGESVLIGVIDEVLSANDDPNTLLQINR